MDYTLVNDYQNLSYEERLEMATHYYLNMSDSHRALLGFVDDNGKFVSVLINVHRSEAMKKYKQYDPFLMGKRPNEKE